MKKTTATLKGIPLILHLAESKDEKTAGYNSVPIREGEGMLFQFPEIGPGNFGWLAVDMSGLDKKLDILFLLQGKVVGIRQKVPDDDNYVLGEGNAFLEVPAGFVEKSGVVVGDKLECAELVEIIDMGSGNLTVEEASKTEKIDLEGAKKKEINSQISEAIGKRGIRKSK